MNDIYFIRSISTETYEDINFLFCVGNENLKKTLETLVKYSDLGNCIISVSEATTCFNGYLVNGEFIDQVFGYDIKELGLEKALENTRLVFLTDKLNGKANEVTA